MRSQRSVNVAVVGLGFMGSTHLRAYLANPVARVVAVCTKGNLPSDRVLRGLGGNIGSSDEIFLAPEIQCFPTLEKLLADSDADLIDICTPTPAHRPQALAALRSGKHVLCEKPLARTSQEASELVQASKTSPGMLMPAMCMRFWPGWDWLKSVMGDQPFGRVLAASFHRSCAMPAWSQSGSFESSEDSGGALLDIHIHDTDFVNFLFGRPQRVFSSGVVTSSGRIDHVMTQYQVPGGQAVFAEGSWLRMEGFNMKYLIHCERATLDFDFSRGKEALVISEIGKAAHFANFKDTNGYIKETEYFVDCISKGVPASVVTARDGLDALEVIEAEEQSIRTGQAVPIEFF